MLWQPAAVRVRHLLVAPLLLGLLLVPSCGDDEALDADELGLSAQVSQSRTARSQGKLDVELRNDGARPVRLDWLQLRSPLFDVVPRLARDTVVPPDDLGTLFLPFGRPRCPAAAGTAELVVGLRTDEGVRELRLPVVDREPSLATAHRAACAVEAVADVARIGLGAAWTRVVVAGVPRVETTLRLTRLAAGEVEVLGIGRSVLLTPTLRGTLLLGGSAPSAEVPVVVAATRCDPHALTESKTSYTFPVRVRVDGGPEVPVPMTVTGPGREALIALVDEVCVRGREHGSTSPGG